MRRTLKVSIEEARIHAHLCADGYLYVSRERENGRWRKRYQLRYSNTDETLREEFANDILTVYSIMAARCRKGEIGIKAKWIFQRLSDLGAGNSYRWFIGSEILKSPKTTKMAWLRAFFDDEGRVELPNPPKDCHRRITIKSVNKRGLQQVQNLLKDLSIKSVITGENSDKTYYLRISRVNNIRKFARLIGFNHPKKIKNLDILLSWPRRHL
jgi:intein/homing endonuclease